MKNYFLLFIFLSFPISSEHLDESPKNISFGLHITESLIGNYGFSLAFNVHPHIELTFPIEWYSFSHSLPGLVALKVANNFALQKGIKNISQLSMFHLKAGIGCRLFPGQNALDSGFYIEPILYAGLLRHSDFRDVEFDNQLEAVRAVVKTVVHKRPMSNHFALSPQINLGYQWISESGVLCQLALYGNYVYAAGSDTIFDAADRFFTSGTTKIPRQLDWAHSAIKGFRVAGTQVTGWHAGASINLGFAF